MDVNMIVSLAVAQVGEEKAKEILGFIKGLSEKLGENVLMLSNVKGRGNCLFISSKDNMEAKIFKKQPKIIDLEKIVNNIEI